MAAVRHRLANTYTETGHIATATHLYTDEELIAEIDDQDNIEVLWLEPD